ncbi:hypothetical protein J6590_061827 [Homalodisca vitripennis]|nr:hypothetical protein J6590_061827 [Homalodisca vitripennis]
MASLGPIRLGGVAGLAVDTEYVQYRIYMYRLYRVKYGGSPSLGYPNLAIVPNCPCQLSDDALHEV